MNRRVGTCGSGTVKQCMGHFLAIRKWSRRNSRQSGSEAVGPWDTSSETVGQVGHGAEMLKNGETK